MEIDRVGDRGLLGRVFREARPFWPQILGLFLVSVLATPLALLGPVPLKIAVDSVLGSDPLPFFLSWLPQSLQGSTPSLLVLAAVFQVAVVLLMELQALAASVLETSTSENLTLSFRGRLLGHLQRLSFSFHDARGTADSIYRIQHDAPALQQIAVRSLIPLICAGFTLVGMILVMLRLDTQLALIALAISPLLYLSVSTFRRRVRPGYRRVKRLESHALAIVQEVLTSFRVVKAFGREREESQRFLDHSRRSMQIRIRLAFAEQAFQLIVRLITAMGTATVLFVGVRKVQSGVLSLGELLMVIAYVGQLYTPLRSISKQTTSLEKHLASAQRAFGLLEEVPEVVERPGARALGRAKGAIRFRDVCFGYEEHELILRDVSFEVPVGTRLGIVGPTGAGKTTLVSLISRLYDPTAGQILLDDTDLRDYKLDDLRNQFAIMLQDPVLFSTSIAENIAYARPGAAMHEIVAASRAAGAHGFISAFEDGYETIVGERGMRLSGGERQRISLARAFLKDAPLLILDEPTSSVDVETESMIMEAFEQLMKDRTTLMIAHRTSTLERCDLILQVENQRVAIGPPARSEPPSASPRALPGDRERRGDGA
jgi:ATP-binding cassette subfamily B protein